VRGLLVTGMFSAFFLGALYLERVLGYDAIDTGLAFLPLTASIAVLSMGLSARAMTHFGSLQTLAVGLAGIVGGLLLLSGAGVHASYFPGLFLAFLLLGLGAGASFLPLLTIGMADAPKRDAGLASGIINVSVQLFGAIGLASLGTIATDHARALSASGHTLSQALTGGYHLAYLVAAVCVAVGIVAAFVVLRPLAHLRGAVAAGEALNPEVLRAWEQATGLQIRDGYGQTETGQLTGIPHDVPARPGSMGRALPGMRLSVVDGELTVDPASVPTFFLGYLGEQVHRDASGAWSAEDRRAGGPWRTGDRVSEDGEGWLYFEGREDDVIVSAGYRIGPFEVESALVAHPAVAEAAAVAAPDEERGAVVRAVVVLREGLATASPELVRELQEHVKSQTAPYKYPRIVDFAEELPKTASGKIKRAELRAG
jgi:MFS family permease